MRGEHAAEEEGNEREDAPAYEGHVNVQQVAGSESIPVGRVGGVSASPSTAPRGAAMSEDPPHSVPEGTNSSGPPFNHDWSNGHSQHYGFGGRGSHRGGNRGLFGPQAHGPFGAPGNGPFGRAGRGPFGDAGRGPFGRGRGGNCRSTNSRPGPGQDWAALGQNIGKMGEEFGRRMGNWGEQFGRQAGAMGQQVGRQAGTMGQQIGRNSASWGAGYRGPPAGAHGVQAGGPSNAVRSGPPLYDEPPSYQGPAGVTGQETGVYPSDHKVDTYPPEKQAGPLFETSSEKAPSKQKPHDYDDSDSDSDASSISSFSTSSSSSSSSSDASPHDAAQTTYLKRLSAINQTFTLALSKGKKPAAEITQDRDLALAKATREKEASEKKTARIQARRTQKRDLRTRKRELAREYRGRKDELRAAGEVGGNGDGDVKGKGKGKGKGKSKAKKSKQWREIKREYKTKRKALKRESMEAKRSWKREKRDGKLG